MRDSIKCPLQMFRAEGKGYIEIAAELGIHPSTVEKQIHALRSKERLNEPSFRHYEDIAKEATRQLAVQRRNAKRRSQKKNAGLVPYAGSDRSERVVF